MTTPQTQRSSQPSQSRLRSLPTHPLPQREERSRLPDTKKEALAIHLGNVHSCPQCLVPVAIEAVAGGKVVGIYYIMGGKMSGKRSFDRRIWRRHRCGQGYALLPPEPKSACPVSGLAREGLVML